MSRQYYRTEGMSLIVAANWAQASDPIRAAWVEPGEPTPDDSDDRWFGTPFQVADARHDERRALRLVREWRGQ